MENPPLFIPNIYEAIPVAHAPILCDSPHSGTIYPDDFHFICDVMELKRLEDQAVDDLFQTAIVNQGGGFLRALFPRSYVDVNRAEDDIDPLYFGAMSHIKPNPSPRALHGHGVIHTILNTHTRIYARPLEEHEAIKRLETYYAPYHKALSWMIAETQKISPTILHLNVHASQPEILHNFFTPTLIPDIILGDRDGTSCALEIRRFIYQTLTDLGYRVSINVPYKGVEIVRRYGQPARGRNSLQLELSKALYLDSNGNILMNKFNILKKNIHVLLKETNEFMKKN
ncbi:MAG: N-formylglutamate amidohydrolase [Pseudobdellovibrionaceae bacterium]